MNLNDYTGKDPWNRFNDVWDAYWDAAVYLQNETLADPDGHERATIIIRRTDPITGVDYYTYPRPVVGIGASSVDPTPLITNYLSESPDKLFLHTHGKYNSLYDSEHFSCYINNGVEIGDLPSSDYYKIQLGLITPKGKSLLYDGRSGTRGIPQEFRPPNDVRIPREDRYNVPIIGFFRRLFD